MRKFYAFFSFKKIRIQIVKTVLTFLLAFFIVGLSFGQTNFDWQTVGSGDWDNSANWEVFFGSWQSSGGLVPSSGWVGSSNTITISHDITLNSSKSMPPTLVIQSAGSLTISFSGKLNISSGNITNNSGTDGLVIKSTTAGTGSLICNSTGLSGTFEQYFTNGRWYLVSPPFSGVTSYDFWDGTNQAFMRPYNSPGGGWGAYYGSPAVGLNIGEGYEYWQDAAPITVTTTGTFITGSQSLSISSGGATDPDWNLLGNPYPCAIDWSLVADKSNVDGSAFYVYDGSGYKSHNGTSGTATNKYIPPMQGFFVKRTSGSSIGIENADKAHAGIAIYKSVQNDYNNHFKVRATASDQESVCVLYQKMEATNGADNEFDAPILFNNDPNYVEVYSLAGDKKSCINIFGEYPYDVYLGFRVPEGGGEFTIEPFDFRNIDESFSILLEDTETGDIIDFNEGASYTFNMQEGGMIEDRILLHLNSTVGVAETDALSFNVFSNANKVYLRNTNTDIYNVSIYSTLGQEVYSQNGLSGDQVIQLDVPLGYYLVKIQTENGLQTEKLYIVK